jgi:hypothetical protein
MAYVVARGNTLLIPSGTPREPDKKHLFVVLTDECKDGFHLLVSISTIRPNVFHDPACIIKAGEHPFIAMDSYAAYRLSQTTGAAHIVKCVDGWLYMKKEPASDVLLQRLCDGVETSQFAPARIQNYYRANGP